jgi:tetrahydromethanopterin S-methyltransferase subunit G
MESMREKWTVERLDDLNRKVDDLARTMNQRFDTMERRFEGIDRRIDKLVYGLSGTFIAGFIGLASLIVGLR